MKYKIEIVVEGGNELKNDLEKGFVESSMAIDTFPDENILSFQFVKLEED